MEHVKDEGVGHTLRAIYYFELIFTVRCIVGGETGHLPPVEPRGIRRVTSLRPDSMGPLDRTLCATQGRMLYGFEY